MKRVGYGRVSTAGQARNGTSLAEQKKLLMAAGVAEEDIYLDAYTGTKMHRPQFDACMAALEPDDEFVVCKLDRFARTATEGTGIVRDLVERGIRVNVLNMGIADNTPMGKMMVTVMLAFAEYERDMIVERTQQRLQRQHEGIVPGGHDQHHAIGLRQGKAGCVELGQGCGRSVGAEIGGSVGKQIG